MAHGYLVLSVASGLFPLYDMAIVAFFGIDKVRFLSPTKIGDTLRLEIEVVQKEDKEDKGGVVNF
jgi:acyl dehydratase